MSRNAITPNMVSAQRYRLQLRDKLIEAIEQERIRTGLTRKTICGKIGFSEASYSRLVGCNGAGTTIDSLILFLHRLGIEVEISLQQPIMSRKHEWLPIETAPKDGRKMILILTPSKFPQVAYSNTWWMSGFSVENKPTHWMPLPEIL